MQVRFSARHGQVRCRFTGRDRRHENGLRIFTSMQGHNLYCQLIFATFTVLGNHWPSLAPSSMILCDLRS